jgi:hypothetical protein
MTKKMAAIHAKYPPKAPLDNLAALVDNWIELFGENGPERSRRDEVVDYCAQAKSLRQAVIRAVGSKRPNGNLHNHQSRVPEKLRHEYGDALLKHGLRVSSFDALHDVCEECAMQGIGPVTIYDVATRIAAYMQLPIQSLYLHAGVRVGWYLLHGHRSPDVERVPRNMIPAELQRLPTDEIEDFLCAYREYLKPWLKKGGEADGRRGSRTRSGRLHNAMPPVNKAGGTIYICLVCGKHNLKIPEDGCCKTNNMLCLDKKNKHGTWEEA